MSANSDWKKPSFAVILAQSGQEYNWKNDTMKIFGVSAIALIGILFSLNAQAKLQMLAIQAPAVYDNSRAIPQRVITECTKLPPSVSRSLASLIVKDDYARVRGISAIDPTISDKALGLKIIGVDARRGGMYSGPKTLTLRADLYQNGALVTSQIFTKYTRGSPVGSFRNCDILQLESIKIASDIFHWLKVTQGKRKLPETLVRVEPPAPDNASSSTEANTSAPENINDQSTGTMSSSASSSTASESQ